MSNVVVLDNVRSDHNVGSIFRTAEAAGFQAIYLCGITPGPKDRFSRENKKLTKVSLGAQDTLEWTHAASTARLLDRLRRQGYFIVALEQHPKAQSFRQLPSLVREHKNHIALVLGTETTGLALSVIKRADLIVEIPMLGQKESLNVSVAFGIVAFALNP